MFNHLSAVIWASLIGPVISLDLFGRALRIGSACPPPSMARSPAVPVQPEAPRRRSSEMPTCDAPHPCPE